MIKFVQISVLFLSVAASGQEIKHSEKINAIAEELAEDRNDPEAADLFSDMLYELFENPAKINSGDEKEIRRLFFLTDFQIKVLADYIKTSGKIVSPFEIANIPGFDRETAEMLVPFMTLDLHQHPRIGSMIDSVRFRQTLLTNFIYRTSDQDHSLIGSPWKNLIRYKLTTACLSGGFTAEKDAGEKFLSGNPPLPDFISGYLAYEGTGVIKHIILGDYAVRYGQGTCINTGLRTGLSLTNSGYLSGRNEIRPYTSVDENNFFRGLTAEFSHKIIDISFFISRNKIDATLNDSTDSPAHAIRSFYKTGLHNTEGYSSKKDIVTETDYGINLTCNFNNIRTGILWKETRLSLPVVPQISDPATRFDFNGKKNGVLSVYYNYLLKKFIFYGEYSVTGLNKYALIQGVTARPADRLNLNFLYRSYSGEFVSFHGNGPSAGSTNSYEHGMFGNISFEAARYLFINAGCDLVYYPWLRYWCSSPSFSKRAEVKIRYFPSQKIAVEALYNFRSSPADDLDKNRIPGQSDFITRSVRGSLKYSPTEYFTLSIRADYKLVNPSGSNGFLLYQDINLRFRKLPVSVLMRYCIFNTSDYESAIYTWENDLLNSFSIPGLYGDGARAYIMASCKIGEKAQLRIKYGITSTAIINSRMKEIREFKLQLRIII